MAEWSPETRLWVKANEGIEPTSSLRFGHASRFAFSEHLLAGLVGSNFQEASGPLIASWWRCHEAPYPWPAKLRVILRMAAGPSKMCWACTILSLAC